MKELLREVFAATLDGCRGALALDGELGARVRAFAARPLVVVAFGKAARPMAAAVGRLLGERPMRGLVVTPAPDDAPLPPFEVIAGGHPLPDDGSLRAGRRALELAASATADEHALFLVSGGGSAMLEAAADPAVTLEQLRALHRALVGSGAPIDDVNVVRRHLSAVKGGRLAAAARGAARQLTLAVSDVPVRDGGGGASIASLASGPTVPDPTTPADCRAVLDAHALWPAVPAPLRSRLERDDLPPPLSPDDELTARSEVLVLADQRVAARHALAALAERGVHAIEAPEVDDWPCERAAEHLLARLDALHDAHPDRPVAVVTTGELSVPLPASPGVGGRNQQFALACAARVAGLPVTVLSCGTDGVDGVSPAAGAVADGTTAARAAARGLDLDDHLRRFDAHPLFEALGDAVVTGPSGINVRDLRVLLRAPR